MPPMRWKRCSGISDTIQYLQTVKNLLRIDTCVYHQPGVDLLHQVVAAENILFGSEMLGAVRGVDPETGHPFDDTRRCIDALALPAAHRQQVFELNARRVYPRLDAALKSKGL